MTTIPIEVAFNIITFLPYAKQSQVCKRSRNESLPYIANIIKCAMKKNRSRILNAAENEIETLQMRRAAHCLYQNLPEKDLNQLLDLILIKRSKYPIGVYDAIIDGRKRKWTTKKIHRVVIYQLSVGDIVDIGW